MTIEMCDQETGELDFLVKAKFFQLDQEDEEQYEGQPSRLRLRLVKKRGNLQKWIEVFNEMQETGFDELLLAPLNHHDET